MSVFQTFYKGSRPWDRNSKFHFEQNHLDEIGFVHFCKSIPGAATPPSRQSSKAQLSSARPTAIGLFVARHLEELSISVCSTLCLCCPSCSPRGCS